MIGTSRLLFSRLAKSSTSHRSYTGGVPGCNLPWKLDSPMRFTAWWLIWGVIGFGAPFLVIRHQLLRK